jgi:hypothetical protein
MSSRQGTEIQGDYTSQIPPVLNIQLYTICISLSHKSKKTIAMGILQVVETPLTPAPHSGA